jgi:hypothetical protein
MTERLSDEQVRTTARVLDAAAARRAREAAAQDRTVCAAEGCPLSFPTHRWGKTRAHDEGWFEQKDGTAWCPDHVPEWVEGWREGRTETE